MESFLNGSRAQTLLIYKKLTFDMEHFHITSVPLLVLFYVLVGGAHTSNVLPQITLIYFISKTDEGMFYS